MVIIIEPKPSNPWKLISIDGVATDRNFVFSNITSNVTYSLVMLHNADTLMTNLSFTYLPIIHLIGNFGYDYTEGNVFLQMPDETIKSMDAKIKWRGGTTNANDKNKRNYKIKFVNETGKKEEHKFFDLRNDDNWILDAGQVDMFRMRNRIATDLWNDFSTSPYYKKYEPKALTGSRGQIVEVFLNDHYQGIFNMCEPIDRKQMKLKKFDKSTAEIKGGLWKCSGWGTMWDMPTEYDNTKDIWDVFELKYPENSDLSPSDYSTLYNAIKFVKTSTDAEFNASVSDYFDLPVILDYYLYVNVLNAYDLCGKNIYWAVYNKQTDKKLTVAMWDLDCTVGQNHTDDPLHPDYVAYDAKILTPTNLLYRLMKNNTGGFADAARKRYFELRADQFSTKKLIARYHSYYDLVQNSGAAKREETRWSGNSDIAGHQLNFSNEFSYIKEWIEHRMIFLDNHFQSTGIDTLTIEDSNIGVLYNVQGQKVNKNYKGLVIKNRRKYIQK